MLSRTTIVLHWLSAFGIILMIGIGLYVGAMPRGPAKVAMIQTHKSVGVIVLVVLLARIGWRLREGWPMAATRLSDGEARLARVVHWFLLVAPIAMIASGIVRSLAYARSVDVFGVTVIPRLMTEKNEALNEAAGAVHDMLALILIAVIAAHVVGALRHHFIKRDPTLWRMLGQVGNSA
ncbi:MAG: cytochrome b [Hyphomicrobium sp.]